MKPPDPVHLGTIQAVLETIAFFAGLAEWGMAGALILSFSVLIVTEAFCQLYERWYVYNGHDGDS